MDLQTDKESIQGADISKWTMHSNRNIKCFTEGEIRRITENYKTIIGRGAFGEVYKGVLDDASMVAVKRLIHNVKENFDKELAVHREINHKNVVRLIGYCAGANALMMVTEYVPNGNLSAILHRDNTPIPLDIRLRIATQCAEALACMHSYKHTQVIHGDIKPDNILLDYDLNAKVSDFGISRLVNTDMTLYTDTVVGSIGYMDPLFAQDGRVTAKSDVYSFGVVLLELLTRKKATPTDGQVSAVTAFAEALESGRIREARKFLDSELDPSRNKNILDELGKLAAECLKMKRDKRPEMKHVAERLSKSMKASLKGKQQDTTTAKHRKAFASLDVDIDLGGPFSFSDHDSGPGDEDEDEDEDEEEPQPTLLRRTTIGNQADIGLSNQNDNWRLLRCQNGLRIFEELVEVEYLARSCSRAMRAVGVVEASCEAIFGLVMSMDVTRYEWDCSFQYGSLVEEVDGHTAILYHRLQLNWCSMLVWPRDLCYVRYWRRNDDGSYVVLFRSTEHQNCGPQPGFVRASIESGGFKISPLKSLNGRPRTQVQHLMQIDVRGWGVNYLPSFQYHSLLQMLNCVAGLCEYFSQTDEIRTVPRIPVMHTMVNVVPMKKDQNLQEPESKTKQTDSKHLDMVDEESEDDDDYQVPESDLEEEPTKSDSDAKSSDPIDLSWFSGIIRQDTNEKSRNCWAVPDSKIFKVRSKTFPHDKSKVPAGKYLMELVAIDWFKDTKRMDHVARRKGSAAQVAADKGMFTFLVNIQIPGPSHYSLVLYFVSNSLEKGSLLQRFADGDDDFRNSRLKLIPSVPKGSWIVRQSVGSTPCLLGKAVDCSYLRGPDYLEVDVDIGSSAVANGVLGLVFGVVTTLVVDMAFLIQANTYDELPEQLLGAARLSHIEPSAAVYPDLENIS